MTPDMFDHADRNCGVCETDRHVSIIAEAPSLSNSDGASCRRSAVEHLNRVRFGLALPTIQQVSQYFHV